MYFRKTYRTIREADIGNAFKFPPTPPAKTRPQLRQLAYRAADSNRLYVSYTADYLEVYSHVRKVRNVKLSSTLSPSSLPSALARRARARPRRG